MKISVNSIINSHQILTRMANHDFSVKTAFKINRILHEIEPLAKDFNDKKNKLFEKMGEKDPANENMIKIKPENEKDFINEINDLLLYEVEIKDLDMIDISEIPDSFKIKPLEILSIEFIKY